MFKQTLQALLLIVALTAWGAHAHGFEPFFGEVTSEGINVRSDATIASEAICSLNPGERFEVVAERYGWYKIRIPSSASIFIHKNMVEPLQGKSFIVIRGNVNLRLGPSESSAILGKVNKGDTVTVLEGQGDWYRIAPVRDSYAWVHTKFVRPLKPGEDLKPAAQKKEGESGKATAAATEEGSKEITVEGLLKPKVIKSIASHKLIVRTSAETDIYLLKGNRNSLNTLNGRTARITGTVEYDAGQEYPFLHVSKAEAVD